MSFCLPERRAALLPSGRRCPEGADEGAFFDAGEVAPHQFGRMTYSCSSKLQFEARWESAAVSHGLTSPDQVRGKLSPPRGEGAAEGWT
jgi:hypothetical protein